MPYDDANIAWKDPETGQLERADALGCGKGLGDALLGVFDAFGGIDAGDRDVDGRVLAEIRALPLEAVRDSLLAYARRFGAGEIAAVLEVDLTGGGRGG